VYIIELSETLIKIGSTKDLELRPNGLRDTFKLSQTPIILDAFDCGEHFRTCESIILGTPEIHTNLYKHEINGHASREVVQLSDFFCYTRLINIVKTVIQKQTDAFSGSATQSEILQHRKLDLIQRLLDSGNSLREITELLNNPVESKEAPTEIRKTINSLETSEINAFIRQPRGCSIQQVDPEKLQPLQESSMSDFERQGFTRSQILRAIKTGKLYKTFRWNYKGVTLGPTTKTNEANNISAVIEINSNKSQIVNSYPTKQDVASKLNICSGTGKRLIDSGRSYNNNYFILYHNCPKELLETCTEPLNFYRPKDSKMIKQINCVSKYEVIYNSWSEVQKKCGISPPTIKKIIDTKLVYAGSIWESCSR
jgi:DNA-binding transcriptional MerR regulator